MTQWYGLMAPANLAAAATDKLATASAQAAKVPDLVARLTADAAITVGSSPADFARFIATEQVRWKQVVARAKIKPD
jgi:tripartite-type tricarboxylate transporter receptor subunit TctC